MLGISLCLGITLAPITLAPIALASPAFAGHHPWPGHPHRHLVTHVVRPGETATGLAVRFHAWTDELLALNHLGYHSVLRVGERLRIPVVDRGYRAHHHRAHHHRAHHRAHHHRTHHHRAHHHRSAYDRRMHRHGWRHYTMTRPQVRRALARSAYHHRVPRRLALAIGWQESGWHQPLVSSAGAVGIMQLLPSTGRWMSGYVGRRLNIRGSYDNILGGVTLIRVLRAHTRGDLNAIAAYYQGLGALKRHGWYEETKTYVRSVRAILRHLRRTGSPAG